MRFVGCFCLLLLGLMIAACASRPSPAPHSTSQPPAVIVTVTREGALWNADFVFSARAPVWVFRHSALLRDSRLPWRPDQWEILTPGVVLDHAGGRDVLRAENGGDLPDEVRIRLHPASVGVEASYNPALVFSGGAVALFSDQFDILPLASVDAARQLPADLSDADLPPVDVDVIWKDAAGPVLFRGERLAAPSMRSAETYVLFGNPALAESQHLVVVADEALPAQVRETLFEAIPELIGVYADRMDLSPPARPMIFASWNGPTPRLRSMGGSVLPGLIAIAFEGEDVLEPSEDLRLQTKLFLAHEAAHFWLGQLAGYEREADMWITEGGADLMAARALQLTDPEFPVTRFLQMAVDDCARLTASGSLATAARRGEHRAFYACGTVFAMVAEGFGRAAGQESWLDLAGNLIGANLDDGIISRADWMGMMDRLSAGTDISGRISRFLDAPVVDPATALSEMLAAAGVPHTLEEGRIVLE